jgi:hypothetical protein
VRILQAEKLLTLKFKDRQAFGTFCVSLKEDHVPFGIVGFESVILTERDRDHLPPKSGTLYARLKGKGLLEVSVASSTRRRPRLLTEKETEELLWVLAKAR